MVEREIDLTSEPKTHSIRPLSSFVLTGKVGQLCPQL